MSTVGFDGVYFLVSVFEILAIIFQLIIFNTVYSATPKKTEVAGYALVWIIFNPIQLLDGFAHIGSLSDMLFYLIILLPLVEPSWLQSPVLNALLSAFAAYIDPRMALI